MPVELTLSYKGFSLRLEFKTNSYYVRTEFEPGKTLYQILFEHLVDKRAVSVKGLARKYRNVNPFLRDWPIACMMQRIEAALGECPNEGLKRMRFVKLPRGGANPVIKRQRPTSRFTEEQRRVIERTIGILHLRGRKPSYEEIRAACLTVLARKGLQENVSLMSCTIARFKRRLGLIAPQPIKQRRRRPK